MCSRVVINKRAFRLTSPISWYLNPYWWCHNYLYSDLVLETVCTTETALKTFRWSQRLPQSSIIQILLSNYAHGHRRIQQDLRGCNLQSFFGLNPSDIPTSNNIYVILEFVIYFIVFQRVNLGIKSYKIVKQIYIYIGNFKEWIQTTYRDNKRLITDQILKGKVNIGPWPWEMGTFLYNLRKTAEAENLLRNRKQNWAFSHTNILSYFP